MKISIVTTITNPDKRQDRWREAINCYLDLADEVIVVDGGDESEILTINYAKWVSLHDNKKLKILSLPWPQDWNWIELPKHLNAGLDAATGDWVINLDIDRLMHKSDFLRLREHLEIETKPVVNISKITVVTPFKSFEKGQIPLCVNKGDYPDVGFGLASDMDTDLCYPIKKQTTYWEADFGSYELPVGKLYKGTNSGIKFYNYDYFFKTKKAALYQFEQSGRAYQRFFRSKPFGRDTFEQLRIEYGWKANRVMTINDHPEYIRGAVQEVIDGKLKVVGNLWE